MHRADGSSPWLMGAAHSSSSGRMARKLPPVLTPQITMVCWLKDTPFFSFACCSALIKIAYILILFFPTKLFSLRTTTAARTVNADFPGMVTMSPLSLLPSPRLFLWVFSNDNGVLENKLASMGLGFLIPNICHDLPTILMLPIFIGSSES